MFDGASCVSLQVSRINVYVLDQIAQNNTADVISRATSGSGVLPVPNPNENNIAVIDLVGLVN